MPSTLELISPPIIQTFQNSQCRQTHTCDLKSAGIRIENYKETLFPDHDAPFSSYGTRMMAFYETKSPASVENYGFVQFIQGCQTSASEINGDAHRRIDINISHYGTLVHYDFPTPTIDNFLVDPLDWGFQKGVSRHSSYLVRPGDQPVYYKDVVNQSVSKLYVQDHPGVAAYYPETGRGISLALKFRTCLYKSHDVPKVVADSNTHFATPIYCFDWQSSFIYDEKTRDFSSPKLFETTPYCTKY